MAEPQQQQQPTRNVCKQCTLKFPNKSWLESHECNYQYICFICGRVNEKFEQPDPPSILFHIAKSHLFNKNFKMNDQEKSMSALEMIDNCRKRRPIVVDGGGIRNSRAAEGLKNYTIPKKITMEPDFESDIAVHSRTVATHSKSEKSSVNEKSEKNDQADISSQGSLGKLLVQTMKNHEQMLAAMTERQKDFGVFMQNMGNEFMAMKRKDKERHDRRLARQQPQSAISQQPQTAISQQQQSMPQQQDFSQYLQHEFNDNPVQQPQPIDQQQEFNGYPVQQPQSIGQQQEFSQFNGYGSRGLLNTICNISFVDDGDMPLIEPTEGDFL